LASTPAKSSRLPLGRVTVTLICRCPPSPKWASRGTGKTHLAKALGIAVCGLGKRVRFYRVTELMTALLEAKEERQLLRMRGQLGKLDLLILDELGYVPASKAGAELLFDVIATAYERNSVLVTTNPPFENWPEVLGNERLTGAVLYRLTHRCHILETKGESYRLKEARRRRGGR
jgi:DNA replication protein DnaC